MLLRWALLLLLLVVLLRALGRFIAGILHGVGHERGSAGASRGGKPVQLARDPVCGTYVVPSRAVTLGDRAARQYFCSDRCRDRYAAERRRA